MLRGVGRLTSLEVQLGSSVQGSMGSDSSLSSVNNDWNNWMILHSNEEVVVDVVRGIGKAIIVKFNGDRSNMFNEL